MFDWEFDTDWTSALEDLDQKHLDMVHNYIMQTHPEEVKEWQEENEEELDAGEQSLKTFMKIKTLEMFKVSKWGCKNRVSIWG